jgi:splicing factor 3A subunit 1
LLSQEAESKKRLEEANRIIREQAQSTVGPTLPVQRKEAPTGIESEPASKRPKITYAPSIAQPTVLPPPPPPITEQMLPPPQPPLATEGEDSFMASAAGAINVPTESSAMAGTAELIPEEEFAASLSKPEVTLQIRIPNDPSQMAWNFYGQIVSLSTHVMSKVKTIKEQLSNTHLNGIPANKIQLKNVANGAFLKDANSLASLNLGPNITLELVPRARGGKKK